VKNHYPIESLLRPPVELWPALVSFIVAIILYLYPATFVYSPIIAYSILLIILYFIFRNVNDAINILRYQRNLRAQKMYLLESKDIPFSRERIMLGRGFIWTQKHTQRLRDTLRPDVAKYTQPSYLYQWARRMEVKYEHSLLLSRWVKILSKDVWWNPVKKYPPLGGDASMHGVEINEQDIWIDLEARKGHTFIAGTTGVGKTRLCELLVAQDIRRGDTTIVICPKGDADLFKRVYAEAKRANRKFYCFHLGYPEISCRYNGVGSFTRVTEVATRIANQLPGEGNAAAFKEFSWRFINIVAQALTLMGEKCSYSSILNYINDSESLFQNYAHVYFRKEGIEDWQVAVRAIEEKIKKQKYNKSDRSLRTQALVQYITESKINDTVLVSLKGVAEYTRDYYSKLVASVGPLLEKLTTGKIGELISPDYSDSSDTRPILDWMTAIRQNAVVYIGLDGLTDMTVASAVGNSIFADIVSVTGRIYKYGIAEQQNLNKQIKYPTVRIHADEFSALVGDEFVPLLNQSRGAGVDVVAYTQTMGDVEVGMGSISKAKQITGNFNTFGLMRVPDIETASIITDKLPSVEIMSKWQVSSSDDSSDPTDGILFRAKNEDRITGAEVPMLEPANFVNLPKGQAFFITEGGKLYKVRIPLLSTISDKYIPKHIGQIASDMKRRYNSYLPAEQDWWEPGEPQIEATNAETPNEVAV